jgi:hypothetical protein
LPDVINKRGSNKRLAKASRVGALIIDKITPICQQNGFVQARILLEWEYIVTPQFAQFCTPLKVTFPLNQRVNGRLYLRASSSMATELSYLEPQIVSRINQFFGYQAISKIVLQQGPVQPRTKPQKKAIAPLPKETISLLESQVQPIDDDRLKAALLSLGTGITQQNGTT